MTLIRLWRRAFTGACALQFAMAAVAMAQPQAVSLEEALAQAQANSPLIVAANARVTAAEGRARQAGVSPNPELGVEVENAIGTGRFSDLSRTEVTVSLDQRLERGGKRRARLALAAAELDFARLDLIRVRADLVRDVRQAFADLVSAEQSLTLTREATTRAEELSRVARLLVETGRDPPLRQFRADAVLASARASEQEAAGNVLRARRALATLLGSDDAELIVDMAPDPTIGPPLERGAVLAVRLAESRQRAAEARVELATATGVPDVTVRGGMRGFADTGDVAVVAGLSVPLAIRDTNRGGIEAARADVLAAEADLAQARLDAGREMQDARTLLDAATARLAALEGAGIEQAREAVRVTRIGYAAGRFTLLEVLDAETALNSALRSIIEARRDRARALAALERANAQ